MASDTIEQALELARAEARTLTDQLRQARAELHRMGIADQNRALVCAGVAGGLGHLVGVGIGPSIRKK
jgi:hypothetical protein